MLSLSRHATGRGTTSENPRETTTRAMAMTPLRGMSQGMSLCPSGYRRLQVLVGREGLAADHKRLYRSF